MNSGNHLTAAGIDDSLSRWIQLPPPGLGPDEIASWAERVAADRSDQQAPPLIELLTALVARPLAPGHVWRFLYLVDLAAGAALWDVAFVESGAQAEPATLLGDPSAAPLGGSVDEFVFHGRTAAAAMAFQLDERPLDEGGTMILGQARVGVARDLPGLGPVTILADAQSTILDALTMSVQPMAYLLTSDGFADLVAATQSPSGAAGRPADSPEPGSTH